MTGLISFLGLIKNLRIEYKEAGPHLLLQAFLQRIINGGGRIHREYALGRKRTDLFIEWPLDETQGFYGGYPLKAGQRMHFVGCW